jgi:hypothetical protein
MPKIEEKPFSPQHLKIFKKEAEKNIKRFGLFDFDTYITVSNENELPDFLALTTAEHTSKLAGMKISKLWPLEQLNNEEIKRTAFHEVCELLLARIRAMALGKFSEEEVNEAIHTIINRLQYAFVDSQKKK